MATATATPTVEDIEDKLRDMAVDSSRFAPIDRESYLVIEANGEYGISREPKELPEGVEVFRISDYIKGQRQFIITKDAEDDTFDEVKVGTLMLENGYAYIAGKVICGEEPEFLTQMTEILIPPFVITYPVSVLAELRHEDDLYSLYRNEIRQELKLSIMTHIDTTAAKNHRCLAFDMNRPLNLSVKYCCVHCGGELPMPGITFCDACDYSEDCWQLLESAFPR